MQGKNNFPSLVDVGSPKDQISPLIHGIGILSSDRYQDKAREEGKTSRKRPALETVRTEGPGEGVALRQVLSWGHVKT